MAPPEEAMGSLSGPLRVDDGWHLVVRADLQKPRLNWSPVLMFTGNDVVLLFWLLHRDADLPSKGWAVVEIHRPGRHPNGYPVVSMIASMHVSSIGISAILYNPGKRPDLNSGPRRISSRPTIGQSVS